MSEKKGSKSQLDASPTSLDDAQSLTPPQFYDDLAFDMDIPNFCDPYYHAEDDVTPNFAALRIHEPSPCKQQQLSRLFEDYQDADSEFIIGSRSRSMNFAARSQFTPHGATTKNFPTECKHSKIDEVVGCSVKL